MRAPTSSSNQHPSHLVAGQRHAEKAPAAKRSIVRSRVSRAESERGDERLRGDLQRRIFEAENELLKLRAELRRLGGKFGRTEMQPAPRI